MADNSSLVGGAFLRRPINDRVVIVQILVVIFLCINLLLIMTFFKKACFYTTTRYILFAVILLSDSLMLFLSDILFILSHFALNLQVWLCIIIHVFVLLCTILTPVTLTAMTLERYVAICMPLRHGELCCTCNTVHCILILHGISCVPCIVIFTMFFASASLNIYEQYQICSSEMFSFYAWQDHIESAIQQFYFLVMCIIIVVSYIKIMKVAKTASGENKKSTRKGLKTVVLHGFQLLLCITQLWCPFIETWVFQINFMLFIQVRFFNYIIFFLAPRCLSSLIYGLRDDVFSQELKRYVSIKRNVI